VARIALVHDIAGVATTQARLLREAGHEVDQIALSELGASWSWPAKAGTIPFRLAAYLPVVLKLRRARYDIVHIHWLTQGVIGSMISRPFFAQAHGSDLHVNLRNPLLRVVTHSVLERAQLVFYVTPNLRAYASEFDSKLRYLPNPVDVSALQRGAVPITGVSRVLIFARLDPVKGVDEIYGAAERLSRTVELTGLDWGPIRREYVKRYQGLVQFVPPVPHDQVGDFLQKFDVVIGQMHQGILSLSELEAMAAGRPVITGIDWSLYSKDDPPPVIGVMDADGIVAAVEKLRSDKEDVARLFREGPAWVERNHGFARHLKLLEEAYFGSRGMETRTEAGAE
jgi:glycosyltransferase involved in cell wall biosynthesis